MFGNQKINVRPREADKVEWFTADHETAGSDDLCFLTSSTPDEVVAHLKANGVAIEEGPVAKQGARELLVCSTLQFCAAALHRALAAQCSGVGGSNGALRAGRAKHRDYSLKHA